MGNYYVVSLYEDYLAVLRAEILRSLAKKVKERGHTCLEFEKNKDVKVNRTGITPVRCLRRSVSSLA